MARSRRRVSDPSRSSKADDTSVGSGGFVRQIGLFETANGLPHGLSAIVAAIVLALVVYPISRLVRSVARRRSAEYR